MAIAQTESGKLKYILINGMNNPFCGGESKVQVFETESCVASKAELTAIFGGFFVQLNLDA